MIKYSIITNAIWFVEKLANQAANKLQQLRVERQLQDINKQNK